MSQTHTCASLSRDDSAVTAVSGWEMCGNVSTCGGTSDEATLPPRAEPEPSRAGSGRVSLAFSRQSALHACSVRAGTHRETPGRPLRPRGRCPRLFFFFF